MKRDGRKAGESEVLDFVVRGVRDVSGLPEERIRPETRIMEDLGVYGDDAYELICMIDDEFEMAPGDFHLEIHFGVEGLGAPLPWHLRSSVACFEAQPMTVGQLVGHIRTGRWPDTPRIPRPRGKVLSVHAASWVQFTFFAGGAAAMIVTLIMARVVD